MTANNKNMYQRKLESLMKVRAFFPNATVCNLQTDVKDFYPNLIRLNHPQLGVIVIVSDNMFRKN